MGEHPPSASMNGGVVKLSGVWTMEGYTHLQSMYRVGV